MLCLCFSIGAQAQDAASLGPLGRTVLETNLEKNLWFSSENPSMMSIRPITVYGEVSLDYDYQNGRYKLQQQGDRVRNISFNAAGAANVKGFSLWGEFHFNNIFTDSTRFNTNMYDPIEDCMPFYVGDSRMSFWTGQSYEMRTKIASPFYWKMISFGIDLEYVTQTSGKQIDPRGNPFNYHVTVIPSLTFKLGSHDYVGLNGYYRNRFQRTVSSNRNYAKEQPVYLLKGLGNFTLGYVGSSGLGDYYWKGDRYGGGLQYGHEGAMDFLADLQFYMQKESCFQNPVIPRPMGSTSQMFADGNFSLLFGHDKSNKVTLEGFYRSTNGIEYVTKYNTDAGVKAWEILSTSTYSNYLRIHGKLSYDKFIGGKAGNGYVWKLGADAKFDMEKDEYYSPSCTFNYMNATAEVNAKRSLWFGHTNLILGFFGGYRMGFGGEYTYSASDVATAVPANVWYPLDLAYYKANCATFGGDLYFGWKVSSRMEVYATGSCSYNAAFLPDAVIAPNGTSVGLYGNSRILAHGAIGISF